MVSKIAHVVNRTTAILGIASAVIWLWLTLVHPCFLCFVCAAGSIAGTATARHLMEEKYYETV